MNEEESIDLLYKVFENVNNWLNFAEAKNAANLAFIIAMLQVVTSIDFIPMSEPRFFLSILLLISGMFSIISFIPNNKLIGFFSEVFLIFRQNNINENDNLIFYKDIKNYTKEEYLIKIYKYYLEKEYTIESKYEFDLSEEIIENSKIAVSKYLLFKIAVCFDIIFFLIIIILLIIA